MLDLDLVVAGGLVVTPTGATEADIGIRGEKVVVITERNLLRDSPAREIIDAVGKVVVPGGIDPHIHCNWPLPDPDGGFSGRSAGPEQVSLAAIHGGTTTLIDFLRREQSESIDQALWRYEPDWKGHSYCDYSFHIILENRVSLEILAQVPEVIQEGFPSFKVFTSDVRPGAHSWKINLGSLWELLKLTSVHHGIVAVHAEEDDLVMHMYDQLLTKGVTHYRHMPDVHSEMSEDLSFRRIIDLARHVPGAALYFMHVSSSEGVHAVAEAKKEGLAVYAETLHQYALRNEQHYAEEDGMKYHTYPSLRAPVHGQALWHGIAEGILDTFATDEVCTTYAEKTRGDRIDNVVGGNSGVEPRMALLYHESVNKRNLGLEKFADMTSTNAAKILGLYPRKGIIAVGSDADLAIIDPDEERLLSAEMLHETDYTPWEGWHVKGWVIATILRGRVLVSDGRLRGSQKEGKRVPRKITGRARL